MSSIILVETLCTGYQQMTLEDKEVKLCYILQLSPRCASLALRHYMLKPIQRIPQYRLLLQGTIKPEFFLLVDLREKKFCLRSGGGGG